MSDEENQQKSGFFGFKKKPKKDSGPDRKKSRKNILSTPRKPTRDSDPSTHKKTKPRFQHEKCRIDELALPSRRLILALYHDHANHLPRDKVEKIKQMLQELYAMTPEDTQAYFDDIRKQQEEESKKKAIKYTIRRLVKKAKKEKKIRKAYEFVTKLIERGLEFASKNSIPPLVSVRLRYLSDIVLEQICDLRNINIPNRQYPDDLGRFLIQASDWIAISVEQLYYGVQLKKNREMEQIEKAAVGKKKNEVREKEKVVNVQNLEVDTATEEAVEEEGIISNVLMSDMEME